jgi:hypothetical protein
MLRVPAASPALLPFLSRPFRAHTQTFCGRLGRELEVDRPHAMFGMDDRPER